MASMPRGKKQKLSKIEKKKMMAEKGKKNAESGGKGISSRQEFVLPAKWECEVRQGKTRQIVQGRIKRTTQTRFIRSKNAYARIFRRV